MTDDQKKMLAENLLHECWHEWEHEELTIPNNGYSICRCGATIPDSTTPPDNLNRTFLTWQDLGDCVSALRKADLWSRFEEFAFFDWHKQSIMKMTTLTDYLLHPTDEKGEPHFCRLAAEFMEDRHDREC